MGLADMNLGSFDADEARYNRMNRNNQSEFAPGQGGEDMSEIFGSESSQDLSGGDGELGSIFGSSGGGMMGGDMSMGGGMMGSGFGGFGGIGQQQPQQSQQKNPEDAFFDAVVKGGKGAGKTFASLGKSFGEVTPLFWQNYGRRTFITGIVCIVGGITARLIGISSALNLSIAGALSAGVGVVTLLFNTEGGKECSSEYKDGTGGISEPTMQPQAVFAGMDDNGFDSLNDSSFDFDSFDGEGEGDGFDDFDTGDTEDNEEDYDDYDEDDWDAAEDAEPEAGMSAEEALATAQEFPKHLYPRSYLYNMFTKTLPKITPNFNNIKEYREDDDIFMYWDEKVREAASVSGSKEDYLPELLELRENLFTIELVCTRPQGFKPDQVAQELANIYAHSEGDSDNVSAKANPVGSECHITIYTGKTAMISLRDMYCQVESYMLDENNYIPVVLGVGTDGEVLKFDFKKLESVIITGMPRSGKSWFCQCVLYQMCAFVPPTELHIYICDPKEGISDFKAFVLPHVKKFVSDDKEIVKTLTHLVRVEGPRRKKIIGDAGFVNIWDYKEEHPEVKIPIIYVVVDEIVTLASRMEKEENKEFRMLLRELISQLPALGIRAFLIPHVLNNDIIEKKTSDLVKCKISVCGDADHVEKATGSKPKDFPHKLKNKGDMAVRMPDVSTNTMFIHGPALTTSNPENNKLFDYARRVWSMLEEDECKTSVAAQEGEIKQENKELIDKLDNLGEDDSDMFSV